MKLPDQVMVLKLEGRMGTVFPTLIQSANHLLLVDTGFPGQFAALETAVWQEGFALSQITGIVLTHQDLDHIGNIMDVKKASPGARIYAHEKESPYISGEETPVKAAQMKAALPSLSKEQKEFLSSFEKAFFDRRISVDVRLQDGVELDQAPGIEIFHTPGHTPGHICLYERQEGILIAGDALNIRDGRLAGADPQHSLDMDAAAKSLKKLQTLDLRRIICYHGGVLDGDLNTQLRALCSSGDRTV